MSNGRPPATRLRALPAVATEPLPASRVAMPVTPLRGSGPVTGTATVAIAPVGNVRPITPAAPVILPTVVMSPPAGNAAAVRAMAAGTVGGATSRARAVDPAAATTDAAGRGERSEARVAERRGRSDEATGEGGDRRDGEAPGRGDRRETGGAAAGTPRRGGAAQPGDGPPGSEGGSAPPVEDLHLDAFTIERPPPAAVPSPLPRFQPRRWVMATAPRRPAATASPSKPASLQPQSMQPQSQQPQSQQQQQQQQQPAPAPAPAPDEAAQGRAMEAARRRARGRYDQLEAQAGRRHAAVISQAVQAQVLLRAAAQQLVDSLPGPMARIDAGLALPLDEQLIALDAAAQQADALVVAAERGARGRIEAAHTQGSAAVTRNLDSAETQITAIVDGLASQYLQTLETTATGCQDLATRASVLVGVWAATGFVRWMPGVGGLLEAEHETRRTTASQRAAAAAAALTRQGASAAVSFREQVAPTRTGIATAVDPPLREHVTAMTEHGQQSLDDARRAARARLRSQAREARDHIEAMRIDARARVFAQRRSARTQIETAAARAGRDAQRETDAASQSLGQALGPSLEVFDGALQPLREQLDAVVTRGPEALDRTGELGLRQVDGVLARASLAQSARIDGTREGVDAGMARRSREVTSEAETRAGEAAQSMAATAAADLPAFKATARAQTAGYAAMSSGVEAATARWSQPFAEAFVSYIEQVREQLRKSHDEDFLPQVTQAKQPYVDWVTPMLTPATAFGADLDTAWTQMRTQLDERAHRAGNALSSGIIDVVDESALSAALRNLTAAQGCGVRALYRKMGSRTIDETLMIRLATRDLDQDEYDIAIAYLAGRAREANLMELDASRGWINDDEARMHEVMRSLSQSELDALHNTEGWSDTLRRTRGALGGTDLAVFDALEGGNPARADAILWRERVNTARVRGDIDGLHDAAAEYGAAATYLGNPVSADERRRQVVEAFATLLREDGEASAGVDAAVAVTAYATRRTTVVHHSFWSGTRVEQEELTGPAANLFGDIVRRGVDSVEARQSRIAVELGRAGGPNMLRLDAALVDNRLNPNFYPGGVIPEETLAAARADRDRVAAGFASRYGEPGAGTGPTGSRGYLADRVERAFGSGTYGGTIGALLVYEEVPSPDTAGHLMRYGMTHETGTNEALLDRVVGRMNRDEIAQMGESYGRAGGNLFADLGVYGHGAFGELSGDERLSMEVKLLGVPRNDRERAEVAAFTAQQQRDETGGVGAFLTSGGFQDRALAYEMAQLEELSGVTVRRGPDGRPVFSGGEDRFVDGAYTGDRRAEFESAVAGATIAAQAYAARVDAWANFAVNAIMVAGAVLATVLTAGGAGPLLLMAVAAGTGLTAMAAHAVISGGRYGWEQALTDLGMTLVQTLTAGLGATLGLASRGGSSAVGAGLRAGLRGRISQELLRTSMGRLTGTALGDVILIGAATNALNMAGTTALQEQTWEKGIGDGLGEVLTGGFTGAFTGGLQGAIGHGLNAIRPGSLPGLSRLPSLRGSTATIGELLGEAGPVMRGFGQGGIGAVSGFAGRAVELGIQAGRGRYRGDAGDLLVESGEAGALAGLQSFGEGVGESIVERRQRAAGLPHAREGAGTVRPAAEEPVMPMVRDLVPPEVAPVVLRDLPPAEPATPVPRETTPIEPAVPIEPGGERTMAGRVPPGAETPTPHVTPEIDVPVSPTPARTAADEAHDQWLDRMRASIRGEGPPPPEWRGPRPKLDTAGSWRGTDPAEAYAAYRVALAEGGGRYEAIIARDRVSGEYQVMLGHPDRVAPPARAPGALWETVLHYHPNLEGALRYTLPAQADVWQAMMARFAAGRPMDAPHVEFVESMIGGQRTRVAIVVDATGIRLEIGAGAAQGGRVIPIVSTDEYLRFWQAQPGGTPLPPPSDPGGKRWVAPGSQEQRELLRGAARTLGHEDMVSRVEALGPETRGAAVDLHTMAGKIPVSPPEVPSPQELMALRVEEAARRTSQRSAQELQDVAVRSLATANEQIARVDSELGPLAARRQALEGDLADVAGRLATARDERADLRVPRTPGLEPEERQAFLAQDPDERARQVARAAELDNEVRRLDDRRRDLEREADPVRRRVGELERSRAEREAERERYEGLRDRSAADIAAHQQRLDEIAARRAVAGGEFAGDYDRLHEGRPCFVAGTPVQVPGGVRPIERLGPGDVVIAFDVTVGVVTQRRVLRAEPGRTQRLIELAVAGDTLVCTPNHRFWLPDRAAWVVAADLRPGWRLMGQDGRPHAIASWAERIEDAQTYNLLVETDHDYFVGQAGLLTHNGKDPDGWLESKFRDEMLTPREPFVVRFYSIVHEDDRNTLIYVGSTEQTLADRLYQHIRDRRYVRGPKFGIEWSSEAGGNWRTVVHSEGETAVRRGPFIIREIEVRTCASTFERFVWEQHFIERIRRDAGATMQNNFGSPPIGPVKFKEFLDAYLAQLCAAR